MYEKTFPGKRYKNTLAFLQKHITTQEAILDLGVTNPFSEIMKQNGYNVENTSGEDLDLDFDFVQNSNANVVTAFEIFEHLLAPYNILRAIKADKIVADLQEDIISGKLKPDDLTAAQQEKVDELDRQGSEMNRDPHQVDSRHDQGPCEVRVTLDPFPRIPD